MTYLELCQSTLSTADTGSPANLRTLNDASEYQSQVTGFVTEAWRNIQTLHEGWEWRQKEFTAVLRPGVAVYAWNEIRLDDGSHSIPLEDGFRKWLSRAPGDTDGPDWLMTDPVGARQSIGELLPIPFETMRARRLLLSSNGRPTSFAIAHDKRLIFHATPDVEYVVHGMYVDGVQLFSSENQTPRGLPDEYHDVIKWKAVMMLHGYDEANESYAFAQTQYQELLNSLERIYLPGVTTAGALA